MSVYDAVFVCVRRFFVIAYGGTRFSAMRSILDRMHTAPFVYWVFREAESGWYGVGGGGLGGCGCLCAIIDL